ncbi:MAG: PIN domain-containing protein [Candidatus Omnitrophica bacterium]|nr:PIN domain-containing protein [Candidatus Omnitrophota bacterium]MCM8793671.1 PIN domain-containing protein [Candidatus Omnitrophota bacterium]
MGIILVRLFFIFLASFSGYYLGKTGWFISPLKGLGMGLLLALGVVLLEIFIQKVSLREVSTIVFGLILGLITAKVFAWILEFFPLGYNVSFLLRLSSLFIFSYLGIIIALRGKDGFSLIIPYVRLSPQNQPGEIVILDTSVIIDGRIADIFQTRFMEGKVVIPRFVLKELQQIADSPDHLKRTRGRRGLDVLNRIKKIPHLEVKIHEEDYPEIPEVDAKLVRLAKSIEARILTNDYNLNKIAELQGVTVLNINDLANALKPVVLPGETMSVRLVKEGKEYNQAVAYLDDGTMVVVEEARHLLGKTVEISVTSVLQTSAGRMIFGKPMRIMG